MEIRLSGEAIAKWVIVFSFLACYGLFYVMMANDEKSLGEIYAHRLAAIERETVGIPGESP